MPVHTCHGLQVTLASPTKVSVGHPHVLFLDIGRQVQKLLASLEDTFDLLIGHTVAFDVEKAHIVRCVVQLTTNVVLSLLKVGDVDDQDILADRTFTG